VGEAVVKGVGVAAVVVDAAAAAVPAGDRNRYFETKARMTMRLLLCNLIIISFLSITMSVTGRAQFPEDALRLSSIGLGIGARGLGMGMAYTGIAGDFTAVYWNPAGLAQLKNSELNVGLSHFSVDNAATFLGSQKSFNNSSTDLNTFGLVYPFPTARGSLVLAVGYSRVNDFTSALSFDGFNPNSSIIPTLNGDPGGMGYELFLTDTLGNPLFRDRLQQRGKVLEGGGLSNWSFAVAIEAAKQLYLGGSLNIIAGSYTYNREYIETDVLDVYNASMGADSAFRSLTLINTINGDISGFIARFGLLYRFDGGGRVGMTLKFPSYFTVREDFSTDGTSVFDVPDSRGQFSYNLRQDGRTDYSVTSPFTLSAGISFPVRNFIIAGDVELTDWTQTKFSNADPLIEQYNTEIKDLFRPTVNLRGGAEYEFPASGLRLRGGFAYLPSPFRGDPSSYAQKYITGGLGFVIQNSIALDFGYAYGFWETYHVNYNSTSTTFEKITTHNLMTTVSYRF
jgi:long-subunit fatty acid transport protein